MAADQTLHALTATVPPLRHEALRALLDPALDPLFRRPSRVAVASAWYGHVPFGYWLVGQTRPRVVVELGTHYGVSYAAFCDAVVEHRLPTRCYAVDTWQGDDYAGRYGEEVFLDVAGFHDMRYRDFSTLLRMTFDEARAQFPDGGIDLLHIDGEHGLDAVRHDFENWLPALSERAVVLFHDINVRERAFGVWSLWDELSRRYPSFEFPHSSGLGLLAVGSEPPPIVATLCGMRDEGAIATLRERFARLGERCEYQYVAWELEASRKSFQADLAEKVAAADQKANDAAAEAERVWRDASKAWSEIDSELKDTRRYLHETRRELDDTRNAWAGARRKLADAARALVEREREWRDAASDEVAALSAANAALREELAAMAAVRDAQQRQLDAAERALEAARLDVNRLALEKEIILGSTLWRAMAPLRAAIRMVRGGGAVPQPVEPMATTPIVDEEPVVVVAAPEPPPLVEVAEPAAPYAQIVFVSGEPDIAAHQLRVARPVRAAEALGLRASWVRLVDVVARRDEIAHAAIVVIWRAVNCPEVAEAIAAAREAGAKLVFDVDDLMFKPELATEALIDGIRTQGLSEAEVADYYRRVREVVMQVDACCCTTSELARHLRELDKPTFVLPNCFDAEVFEASRLAVRRRVPADYGVIRIGYAAGTRTHQHDFRPAAAALGRLLRENSKCRLVLFRGTDGSPMLDPAEFPELDGLDDKLEWRDLVPVTALPDELARFDINLAPLEVGNAFCEAKSELKYYEAALVDVCTIASPTGPMRRAIRDGVTGRLAETAEEWYAALRALVEDRALRERLGRAAQRDALARFGPERSAEALRNMLRQVLEPDVAVEAFELDWLRQRSATPVTVDIPDSDVVFCADRHGIAAVTVTIPLYNYADFIEEALDSVRDQTLEALDLVVVDDCSTDDSLNVALSWVRHHAELFNRVVVVKNRANSGLARSRNVGFDRAETRFVLPLDADNRLMPECCERLLDALRQSGAAFAYPMQQCFGTASHVIGGEPFSPLRLASGNYIDAMALVAKSAWAKVGGYTHIEFGWEDYDFWCCCVEHGLRGAHVPDVLAEYRFHERSMRLTMTDKVENNLQVIRRLEERHGWLSIVYRDFVAMARAASDQAIAEVAAKAL